MYAVSVWQAFVILLKLSSFDKIRKTWREIRMSLSLSHMFISSNHIKSNHLKHKILTKTLSFFASIKSIGIHGWDNSYIRGLWKCQTRNINLYYCKNKQFWGITSKLNLFLHFSNPIYLLSILKSDLFFPCSNLIYSFSSSTQSIFHLTFLSFL